MNEVSPSQPVIWSRIYLSDFIMPNKTFAKALETRNNGITLSKSSYGLLYYCDLLSIYLYIYVGVAIDVRYQKSYLSLWF